MPRNKTKQIKVGSRCGRDQQALQQAKERMRAKNATQKGIEKKICLTMIVRNEAKNMYRLLDSVKEIIDMVSIVDTGSEDDTKELIAKWGEENKIPTTVHEEPFLNFSHNRTHSIQAAKKTYPDADYFLLSDADFVWEINRGCKFNKSLLIDHKYLIEQYNRALSYWNIRLLSAKVDWECIGVTHEYWQETKSQVEYTGEVRAAKIYTLAIDDREDGGCKTDKFTRDECLLRGGLADPTTVPYLQTRYKFYLAQTLKDLQRHHESIEWYTKRVHDKGWAEEVYYAKYQIGFNHEQLGHKYKRCVQIMTMTQEEKKEEDDVFYKRWNTDNSTPGELSKKSSQHFVDASVNYMAAYKYRKQRAESLYGLTRMYRILGMNEMAFELALLGKDISYPEQDTLFIERGCYEYLFDYELSIVACYLPEHKDVGREAIVKLMNTEGLPAWLVDITTKNSRAYI